MTSAASFISKNFSESSLAQVCTIKTVLGDKIIWPISAIPWNASKDTDQLWRCKKHKKFEGRNLLKLQHNAVFFDIGAHFGDTVITMALHAKNHGRNDIHFVAIEPSKAKVKFIKKVLGLNGMAEKVTVVRACCGASEGLAITVLQRTKRMKKYEGSVRYQRVQKETNEKENEGDGSGSGSGSDADSDSDSDTYPVVTLSSLLPLLPPLSSPCYFLHLDVEGWEHDVLQGSRLLLSSAEYCMVVAEVWTKAESKKRGGTGEDPSEVVRSVIEEVGKGMYERREDLVDQERNVIWEKGGGQNLKGSNKDNDSNKEH